MDDACCRLILAAVDAHVHGAVQRRTGHSLVAITASESGVGDQLSSFLGVLTLAIGARRRLEILPDGDGLTSYIAAGFELSFDAAYSGRRRWVDEAARWLQSDAPPANRTRLTKLPHLQRSQWGLTVATDEATLAARLIVPSPSGQYPPMHPSVFDRPHEFVLGGNLGNVVFRSYFEREVQAQGVEYSPGAPGCVLRHLLRPNADVRTRVERLRPPTWPTAAPAAGSSLVIGVHIRAEAHLLNRAAQNEKACYEMRARGASGAFAADRVFNGCTQTSAARSLVDMARGAIGGNEKPAGHVGTSRHQLANYSEYWLAALAATRRRRGRAAPPPSVRWLVMSDAIGLKQQAMDAWPGLVSTTEVVPAQVGACGAPKAERRERVLRTVAELVLLSQSHVLVLGRSRFPVAALLLSSSCREAYHLFQDKRCRRRAPARAEAAAAAEPVFVPARLEQSASPPFDEATGQRKVLRCFGTRSAYSARTLQDGTGRLLPDGMLSNF